MPGYPLIDKSNDYLMARYDKAVLDAKPWCVAQQGGNESESESAQEGEAPFPEGSQLRRLEVQSASLPHFSSPEQKFTSEAYQPIH